MDWSRLLRTRVPSPAWALLGWATGLIAGVIWMALGRSLSPLPYWMGMVLVVGGVHGLWVHPWVEAGRQQIARWWERVPEDWQRKGPFLAVALITASALWPLPAGVMPIGQDHAYHFFATEILVRDLLPEGRLFGWSERFATGRPFGDTYATAAYLVTALPHVISFGAISLEASYAIGVFIVWLLGALGAAAWAMRLARAGSSSTHGSATWVAPLVAGTLFTLDPGGDRQGGWVYAMFHGVWPQLLSTALWVIALLTLVRLAERQTWGRLGMAVLMITSAIWTHPVGAVNMTVAAPLLLLAVAASRWLAPDDERAIAGASGDPRRALPWLGLALGMAAVAGMGWVSRMLHAAEEEYLQQHHTLWGTMRELVLDVLRGQPFDHQWAVGAVAAMVGVIIAVRRRTWLHVFVLAAVAAFLVLGSAEPLLAFDLGVHPDHKPLMYNRFSISVKPFWYALAGVGVAVVAQAVRRWLAGQDASSPALRVMTWVILAPLLWSAWQALPGLLPTPVGRPLTADSAQLEDELHAMEVLFQREARRLGDGPKRVVFWETRGKHGSYPLIPIAKAGFGFISTRMPPVHTFRDLNMSRDPDVLRFLGASLLVTEDEMDWPGISLLGEFGRHRVYRIQDEPSWPARVEGPGRVRVRSWKPMHRVLELSGTSPDSRLVIGDPPYDKWVATQGEDERILSDYDGMKGVRLRSVDDLRDGTFTLRYEDTPRERRYAVAAIIVLGLALLASFLRRRPLPWIVWGRGLQGVAVATVLLCLLGLGTTVATAMRLGDEALEVRWLHGDRGMTRILQVMHRRRPDVVTFSDEARCVQPYTRRYRTACSEAELEPELHASPAEKRHKERGVPLDPPGPAVSIPSCLRVGVPGSGHVRLEWTVPPGTRALRGRLVTLNRPKVVGTLRMGSGGVRVASDGNRFSMPRPDDAQRAVLRLQAPRRKAFACIELVAVGAR